MISVNLSIDQLSEAIKGLDVNEKEVIRQLLDEDEYGLSAEQENILRERHDAYERGEMKTYTVAEVKKRLNYTDDQNATGRFF